MRLPPVTTTLRTSLRSFPLCTKVCPSIVYVSSSVPAWRITAVCTAMEATA